MKNSDFINSLKQLVIDEKRAENTYRQILLEQNNVTSNSSNFSSSSESTGNIQQIEYQKADDEFSL